MTMRRRGGFTLVEALVAIGILSMVSVSIVTVFAVCMSIWRRGDDMASLNSAARGTFDLLQRDLRGAYYVPGDVGPSFVGTKHTLTFVALGETGESTGQTDLLFVHYYVTNEQVNGENLYPWDNRLMRAQRDDFSGGIPLKAGGEVDLDAVNPIRAEVIDNLGVDPDDPTQPGISFGYARPSLRYVNGELLMFPWDESLSDDKFQDSWNSDEMGGLPTVVRVKLTLVGRRSMNMYEPGDKETAATVYTYVFDIFLPSSPMPGVSGP